MKILAVLVEPAGYTLDLIENIYIPKGINYVFLKGNSLASNEDTTVKCLNKLNLYKRIIETYKLLSEYDAFNINGYTGFGCILFILTNIIFFQKSFTIDSDTELIIPTNIIKRCLKWIWLHFLFTRKYCYGFAGGNYGHKELFRYYGMIEKRIFLAPMVVDNKKFSLNNKRKNNAYFSFGYVGRLIKIKQVDKIIEAIRILVNKNYNVELKILGDGEERHNLELLAHGLPVKFMGAIFGEEKIFEIQQMDCLILYSSYEPWGLVVNEALACGTPVIVSDKVGSRKDLVEGNEPTGLVAKWDKVEDLVTKMQSILTNDNSRTNMIENGVRRIDKWGYKLYSLQYDSFLNQIKSNIK